MGLKPGFYFADIQSGDLYGTKLPLEGVRLESSLQPGRFTASLDLRKYAHYEGRTGSEQMREGRSLVNLLRNGKCTLVPVLEGRSNGSSNPLTSRALGEWWISNVNGTQQSPIISISGPEFAGYTKSLLLVDDFIGNYDPVALTRTLLSLAFTYSQDIIVDLQSWTSDSKTKVPVDHRQTTVDYWSAIADLQENPDGPFEWLIRAGLEQDGGAPRRVTRRLEIGQPTFNTARPGVTLSLKAPGEFPSSVLDRDWSLDEARNFTNVNGYGAGSGKDQIGPVHKGRKRQSGEPGKSTLITDRSAMTRAQVLRSVQAALKAMTPEDHVFNAVMPTDRYTPRVGEVYTWRQAASWTVSAEEGSVRVNGWSWDDRSPDQYELALTEV